MTPTERYLTIVRCLRIARHRGQRSVTSRDIRRKMAGEYAGEGGDRKWRRDIRTLRDRGLIATDLPPGGSGITLRIPPKPAHLHLTIAEHDAINRARQALRPGVSVVSPSGRGRPRAEIDNVGVILRFLEAEGDEVEFARLAEWLEVSERRAFELVDHLAREGVFHRGLVASMVIHYRDQYGDSDDVLPQSVSVFRGQRVLPGQCDGRRPTRFLGMDELGFFPFSLAETNERLALIDEALTAGVAASGIPAHLNPRLRSAGRKLAEWRYELTTTRAYQPQ